MKYTNCIICGSDKYKVIYKTKSDNSKTKSDNMTSATKVMCKACGFIYQNPTFTTQELKDIYSAEYGIHAGYKALSPTEKFLKEKKYRAQEQLRWLEAAVDLQAKTDVSPNGKKALEIGCSAGLLLNLLKVKGWEVEGVEPAVHFAEYARSSFDIPVHTGFLEEIELKKSSYDLIVLSHVLEHMPDPVSVLSKLSSYLKPGGFLFLEVPNIRGVWRNFSDQLSSRHLFIPSVNTMQRIVAKAGMRFCKIETIGRVIRCLISHASKSDSANRGSFDYSALKKDKYWILSLSLRFQCLSSWLFKRLSFAQDFIDSSLSDSIIFTVSNYINTFFFFISSFIIRRVLGPLTMGLYTELMLILDYGKFHHLGIINAMEREVPFYIGKNNLKKVEEVKKTTFIFIALSAVNVGIILFIISLFGGVSKAGLRLVAVLILVETIVSFYEALLQSYRRFKIWSLLLLAVGVTEVLLKVIAVIRFGLNGLLVATILTGIISIISYQVFGRCRFDLRAKIYFKEVLHLLKIGVPLIFLRIMYLLSLTLDRLVIIYLLGRLQLGYYSIATMVSNYLILMPKFCFRTLYPRFMEDFGKNENIEDIKKYLIVPNKVFGCLFSVLIGFTVVAIPFLVTYLLPRFKEGIFAAQMVALSAFFAALVYTWNYLFIAIYKQKRLAFIYGIGAAITLLVNLFFVGFLRMQINGVALATLISQFIFTTMLICDGYRHYTKKLGQHLKLLLSLYFPFFWAILAMLARRFYTPAEVSWLVDLLHTFLAALVFLFLSIPLILYMVKKEQLLLYLFIKRGQER